MKGNKEQSQDFEVQAIKMICKCIFQHLDDGIHLEWTVFLSPSFGWGTNEKVGRVGKYFISGHMPPFCLVKWANS
jgi:hypothetical protein